MGWEDGVFLDFFYELCELLRVLPAVRRNATFFWILYYFSISFIIIILILFIYMIFGTPKQFCYKLSVLILNECLTALYWILFNPIMEIFITVFKCDNDYHEIDKKMLCYKGIHIFYVVLTLIFMIIFILITFFISIFYNETQANKRDASAKIEYTTDFVMIIYRIGIIFYTCFVSNVNSKLILELRKSHINYYIYIVKYNSLIPLFNISSLFQ